MAPFPITLGDPDRKARYSLKIGILAYPTSIRPPPPVRGQRRNIAIRFGVQKLEWFGYPMVKNVLLVLTEFTNVTDGHTDGRTA